MSDGLNANDLTDYAIVNDVWELLHQDSPKHRVLVKATDARRTGDDREYPREFRPEFVS